MRSVAKAVQFRRVVSGRHHALAARTALALAGAQFALIGLVLAIDGYLFRLDGSAFQLLVGLGLIVSGLLVARRKRVGAWTYMLVFVGTVSWSLRNIDVGSTLGQRLVGPALLLVMFAVLMPLLCGWQPRQTVAAFTLLSAATVALSIASLPNGPLAHQTAAVTQFLDAETKGLLQ